MHLHLNDNYCIHIHKDIFFRIEDKFVLTIIAFKHYNTKINLLF